MLILKRNHQLFKYEEVFGRVSAFDPTLIVDAGFLDIEPVGSVACTSYTADKVKSGQTKKRYDHNWLWEQMVKAGKTASGGASPQDAFSLAVKGQKVVPSGEIDTSAAYFQTEIGESDFFTNVKSAIQIEHLKGFNRPVGCGTFWYDEWNVVPPNETMPVGKNHISDHEWVVCGWDAEHPDCFKIDAHLGYYMYMPRDVFNKAMDATYGSVALTLAETSQEVIDFNKQNNYSIIQSIIDKIYNALKILQVKIKELKPMPIPVPVHTNKIIAWANAIKNQEGARPSLNNPGNLKVAPLTQSWGATNGFQATDGGWIAKFATYNQGFTALCNFLTLGCHDELKNFHDTRTLQKFMEVYAGHPPFKYISSIAEELGVDINIDISTFLV